MQNDRSSLTVLIADDSLSVRTALADTLGQAGYRVILAADGEEAVAKARELRPDCITLDVDMPRLDGYEACARIRRLPQPSPVPVVFITSNDTLAHRARGFHLGAIDYLSKQDKDLWREVLRTVDRILLPAEPSIRLDALVVQNDPMAGIIISSFLRQQGVNCILAGNTTEAMQILETAFRPFSLVLSQHAAAGIDGEALSRFLRADPRWAHVPVILFCPENEPPRALEIFRAGATDYIVEPYTRELLSARLQTHLEAQRLLRRLEEEKDRTAGILAAAGEGIIGVDRDCRVTFANPAALALLGYEEHELLGQDLHALVHSAPDGKPLALEACSIHQSLQTGKKLSVAEDTFWRKGRTPFPVKYVSSIQIKDGRIAGGVISMSDITEQKKAQRLRDDVERITRHDLKSPLNAVIGLPQLLRMDPNLTDAQRSFLSTIEKAGYRMLQIVNLSLDLYKMEQGTYPFSPQDIDLLPVVRSVLADNERLLKAQRLKILLEWEGRPIDPVDPPNWSVHAEELLCYSMLANLVKNAIEASPPGEAITICYSLGRMARISIQNHGAVPEGIRATFFDKYVTSGKTGGTGLGTYASRLMAITQMGGIEMTTSEADGTTITISLLPTQEARHASTAPSPAPPIPSTPPPPRRAMPEKKSGGVRILVAEDDFVNQVLVQNLLSQQSWGVTMATHGQQAVDLQRDTEFDVILMDLQMPTMDGFTASAKIRAQEKESGRRRTPIIAVSGNAATPEMLHHLKEVDIDGFMAKPIDASQLYVLIRKYLEQD